MAGESASDVQGPGPPLGVATAFSGSGPVKTWKKVCEGKETLERFTLSPEVFVGKVKVVVPSGDDRAPVICFDPDIIDSLAEAWNHSIIFRPIGSKIGFEFMEWRISSVMNIQGSYRLSDLPNGFFLLKLKLRDDYERILSEGPWCCFGLYLVVRSWSLDFDPLKDSINLTPVWVRIHQLPMIFYEETALKLISSGIGELIRIDPRTLLAKRGRFARVSVCVDLSKPLPNSIVVQGSSYHLEFENLSAVCLSCGVFGHFKAQCPINPEIVSRRDKDQARGIEAYLDCRGKGEVKLDRKPGDQWKTQGKKRWVSKSSPQITQIPATGIPVAPPTSSICSVPVANSFDALEGVVDPGISEGIQSSNLEACASGKVDAPITGVEQNLFVAENGRKIEVEDKDGTVADSLQAVNCGNRSCSIVEGGKEIKSKAANVLNHRPKKSKEKAMKNGPNTIPVQLQSPIVGQPIDSLPNSFGPDFDFDKFGHMSPIKSLADSTKVEKNESGLKRGFLGPFTRAKAHATSVVAGSDPNQSRSQ